MEHTHRITDAQEEPQEGTWGEWKSHIRGHWFSAHMRESSQNNMTFVTIGILEMDGQK